jgi:hypothetical protein
MGGEEQTRTVVPGCVVVDIASLPSLLGCSTFAARAHLAGSLRQHGP